MGRRVARGQGKLMGGPRITPEQMERAAEVFARTHSVPAAAKAVGVSVAGLQDAFRRAKITKNRQAHARACERGIRTMRGRLLRLGSIAEDTIGNAGELEPKDLAALMNAVSKASDTLAGFAHREDSRRQSKLAREKTRKEIEFLSARIAGTLPPEKVDVTHDARDTLAERFARLAGALEPRGAGPGDPPPESGGS